MSVLVFAALLLLGTILAASFATHVGATIRTAAHAIITRARTTHHRAVLWIRAGATHHRAVLWIGARTTHHWAILRARATLHVSALHISAHHRSAHDLYAADLFPTTFSAITTIAVVTIALANRNADQEDQHTE